MVFSSSALYLDPPNWQQHPNQQLHQQQQQQQPGGGGPNTGNDHQNQQHHLMPPHVPVGQPPAQMGAPPIRPNSMAERARLAKIPAPEAPLPCPRCQSTNTKFCYFNNYSLSQPRHFCKTCRRYWTRGGALRNVPVGGGCRRNKRSSSSSSNKSSSSSAAAKSTSSLSSPTAGSSHLDLVGPNALAGIPAGAGGGGMSFMASLQNIAHLGMGGLGLTSFGGSLHHPLAGMGGLASEHNQNNHNQNHQMDFNGSGLLNQQPNQVQFPSGLFEMPGGGSGLFHNDQGVVGGDDEHNHQMNVNVNVMPKSSSSMNSQLAPVKMEEGRQGLNLAKQLMMGISSSPSDNTAGNHHQFWGGATMGNSGVGGASNSSNMWTDLSGLNSSSSSHLM